MPEEAPAWAEQLNQAFQQWLDETDGAAAPPQASSEALTAAFAAMGCTKSDGGPTDASADDVPLRALGAPATGAVGAAPPGAPFALVQRTLAWIESAHDGTEWPSSRQSWATGVADGFAPSVGYALTTYCGSTALQMLQGCRPTPERVALLGYAEAKRTLSTLLHDASLGAHAPDMRGVVGPCIDAPGRGVRLRATWWTVADGEKARDVRHGALLLLPERFLASCLEEYTARAAPVWRGAADRRGRAGPADRVARAAPGRGRGGGRVRRDGARGDRVEGAAARAGHGAAAAAGAGRARRRARRAAAGGARGQRVDVARAEGRRVHYVAMASDDPLAGLTIRWDTAAARAEGLALVTSA